MQLVVRFSVLNSLILSASLLILAGCTLKLKLNSSIDVEISSPLGQKTSATTIPIFIDFSDDVESLSASDIKVTNATKGALTRISSTRYSMDLIPVNEGLISVEVDGAKFSDITVGQKLGVTKYEMLYGDPPVFSGLKYTSRISESEVQLGWDAAVDNVTPESELSYEVCVGASANDCVNNFVVNQTVTGLTSVFLSGLSGIEYHFLVRVKDALGFKEENVAEAKNKKLTAVALTSTSYNHCALLSDATVKCWGDNSYGQLGVDSATMVESGKPLSIAGLSNVVQVASGTSYASPHHLCFLISDGSVKCIGRNNFGQLGNGNTTDSHTVVNVVGLGGPASYVAVGSFHSCAIVSGQIKCWGGGTNGQLGNGASNNSLAPVTVSGINTAIQVAGSYGYTCAVLADTTARCWGLNTNGKLGNNSTVDSNVPVVVTGLNNAVKVVPSSYSTCALLSTGQVRCWGTGGYGALGNGATADSSVPVAVTGINTATDLSSGGWPDNYCALLADQTVRCWGKNFEGDLGLGHMRSISTSETVIGLSGVTSLANGRMSSCALLSNQTIKCWGIGKHGLGSGNAKALSNPVVVPNLTDVVDIHAGAHRTCAIKTDQTVQCWGSNDGLYALLGSTTSNIYSTPTTFPGLTGVTGLAHGLLHSCALLSDKTVKCWGQGTEGALGNGTWVDSTTPVLVSGINTALKIVASRNLSCALLQDGSVKCWGGFTFTLGDGATTWSNTPRTVPGLTDTVDISVTTPGYWSGYDSFCAVKNDGTVRCWGANMDGQLGDGTTTNQNTVVQVAGINNAVKVTAAAGNTCVLLADATVKCWGYNGDGRLGTGNTTNSLTPVTVPGLSSVVQIADGGGGNVCAVLSNNTLKCWGNNSNAQLGKISLAQQLSPITVNLVKPVAKVSPLWSHVCAIHTGKTVSCWGDYGSGNLGNGYQTMIPSAIAIE